MPPLIFTFTLAVSLLAISKTVFSASYNLSTSAARSYAGWESSYHQTDTIGAGAIGTRGANPSFIRPCAPYCDAITLYGGLYGVPVNLLVAVITQESRFDPNARSHAGAKGLMQLMNVHTKNIDPYNPADNIKTGTAHLARLLKRYDSTELALAAYNAGEGNVAKYGGIPPFKETKQYIRKVMQLYQEEVP